MRAARRWREGVTGLALVALPLAVLSFLLLIPAARAITETLRAADGGWTLEGYRRFWADPQSVSNYLRTLWTTAVTLALLLSVCLPIAIWLHFSRSRLAAVVQALALFPMFVPGIIVAYALIRTIGPNGVVQTLLEAIGIHAFRSPYLTKWGPVIGLVWDHMPLSVLILGAGMARVPHEQVEAARDVGAGPLRILTAIILPRILDSLAVVIALNVIGIFGAFIIPYMLGPAAPEMMGPYMLRTFAEVRDAPYAAVQAVITFLTVSVFGIFYVVLLSRNRSLA